MVGSSNRFVLQEISDGGIFLPTVYERGASGTFKPGRYVIGMLHSNCFFFWFSLYLSPLGKWSGGSPKINDNVCGWRGSAASEEGKGQRDGNRGVGGIDSIDKGVVSTLCPLTSCS